MNQFHPSLILVETSAKSLELSQYVYETREKSSLESFVASGSPYVETEAFCHAFETGLNPNKLIFPIDVESFVTRRRLAYSLLPHPFESLILISRYYGRSYPSTTDSDSIVNWRRGFQSDCPTAFRILFSEREQHMSSEIFRHLSTSPPGSRIAALVGLSHMDAIYDKLVLRCQIINQ
jgi:pheromone shutdown protein TraB